MKKLIILLLALLLPIGMEISAKKTEKDNVPEYYIEGTGETPVQGTYNVKVSVVMKKAKDVTDDVLARCAVHGVLFKGFSDKATRHHQKPLAGSPAVEAANADFFKEFFKEGSAAGNYAEIVGSSKSSMKTEKGYRVTTVVTVNKDQLRKDLETAGVIKGLNSIF